MLCVELDRVGANKAGERAIERQQVIFDARLLVSKLLKRGRSLSLSLSLSVTHHTSQPTLRYNRRKPSLSPLLSRSCAPGAQTPELGDDLRGFSVAPKCRVNELPGEHADQEANGKS